MAKLADIDKAFKVETKIEKEGLKFFSPEEEPFKIYGVYRDNDRYRRLPEDVAKATSEGVHRLHANTAGGRVRFITDSPYVAINVKVDNAEPFDHFAYTGIAGLDLYVKQEDGDIYTKTFRPPHFGVSEYESIMDFEKKAMREITINMPLYADIKELFIGLDENSVIKAPTPYKIEKPVVYYGSSITQGGCASRPGMAYEAIISRALDVNHINLGFSGSAKGEQPIVDYIKNLDMSVFVMDYDHNAPSIEHLEETHEKMFKEIRKVQPDLPIVMLTRPKYYLTDIEQKRLEIVKKTYDNAISAGDKNVYFIPGNTLIPAKIGSECTVDTCHPTDLGFFSMAQRIIPVLKEILSL